MNAKLHHYVLVDMHSGNGLVPSDDKSLPKPMLTISSYGISRPQRVNKFINESDVKTHMSEFRSQSSVPSISC